LLDWSHQSSKDRSPSSIRLSVAHCYKIVAPIVREKGNLVLSHIGLIVQSICSNFRNIIALILENLFIYT
jgi:hypothetical protein